MTDAARRVDSGSDRPAVAVVDERPWAAAALVALLAEQGITAEALDSSSLPAAAVGEGVALVCVANDDIPRVVGSLATRGWRVVVYGRDDDTAAAAALEAGATALVDESAVADDLVATVRRAKTGLPLIDPAERDRLRRHLRLVRSRTRPDGLHQLTRREREVLGALVDGRRAADIAAADFVSVTTVRNQIQSILTKLNVRSQLEAVALARRLGWPEEERFTVGGPRVAGRREGS